MSDLEYFAAMSRKKRNKDYYYYSSDESTKNWKNYCMDLYPLCAIKKSKLVEGYTFNDSDETDSASDNTPLVKKRPTKDTSTTHVHIITGYVSIIEVILLLVYFGGFIGMTLYSSVATQSSCLRENISTTHSYCNDRMLLSLGSIIHSFLWLFIALIDRFIQWRHQILRRKGYLKFYRKMRNVRRMPFIILSTSTAILLIFISLMYSFNVSAECGIGGDSDGFKVKYLMMILIGLEMIISIPCLVYYIGQTCWFNYRKFPPDVIQETSSISNSPTATLTTVGFVRDGEDLDELLERQADMIRYLQQHNASLGRKIMELQSRTLE